MVWIFQQDCCQVSPARPNGFQLFGAASRARLFTSCCRRGIRSREIQPVPRARSRPTLVPSSRLNSNRNEAVARTFLDLFHCRVPAILYVMGTCPGATHHLM